MPARDEATTATATTEQGATAATPPQIKTQSDPATGGVKLRLDIILNMWINELLFSSDLPKLLF